MGQTELSLPSGYESLDLLSRQRACLVPRTCDVATFSTMAITANTENWKDDFNEMLILVRGRTGKYFDTVSVHVSIGV